MATRSTLASQARDGQGFPPKVQLHRPTTARDRSMTRVVYDALKNDARLSTCPVEVSVRGGVAHVAGQAADREERELVRAVVARVRGICAVWDLQLRENAPLRVIDIGCGPNKQYPWSIGIDRIELPGVDVVTDLEAPLPLAGNTIDHVVAVHCLEHVQNLLGLMNEIHRVLRPGGVLHLIAPHWQCVNAVADPTHVRFFDRQTIKYFCRTAPGVLPYRPLSACQDCDNVYADLRVVKRGELAPDEETLALFFD